MVDNGRVNVFASDPFSSCLNNIALRDDGHIGGSPADINNRGSVWVVWSYTCAECSSKALFNHHYPADTRMLSSVEQRPLLDLRYSRQDTHHCATAKI
jgi:hypothetical protein